MFFFICQGVLPKFCPDIGRFFFDFPQKQRASRILLPLALFVRLLAFAAALYHQSKKLYTGGSPPA